MKGVEIVTIGEVLAIMLAEQGLPLGAAGTYTAGYAGAEANTAVGLARLGHSVALVTRLGDDDLGRRVHRELRGEGLDVSAVRLDPGRPTGLIVRDAMVGRPTSVAYYRDGSAATALTAADVDAQTLASARALHLCGITPALSDSAHATCLAAVEAAREAGVVVTFDPNVRRRLADADRWREISEVFAARADVVLVGADDADVIGVEDPIRWAHELGAHTVVVKDGARGAVESEDGVLLHQPAIPVPVVDTVGAGDAFAAGWLSGWLRGVDRERRLAEAVAVAAAVVATRGDVPGLPDPAARDRIREGSEVAAR